MKKALKDEGYLHLKGLSTTMDPAYVRGIYDFAKEAHALPVSIKRRCAESGTYAGPDAGARELAYDGASVSSARSWEFSRHAFSLGTTKTMEYPTPDYTRIFEDLYERQDRIGRALAVAFAEILQLPDRYYLANLSKEDFGTIRLLFYPGDDDTDADIGIAPHTDFEAFPLMHETAPGLQFFIPSTGSWIDAPLIQVDDENPDPGFFVVIGDSLERLTNGTLKATPHRVLRRPHDRSSIIRFFAFAPTTMIAPLPQFGVPKYSSVSMDTHMRTTMRNVANGIPSWDSMTNTSRSATYIYDDSSS